MNKILIIAAYIVFLLPPAAFASGKVLLVHSYHTGHPWTDDITAGVKKGLAGAGCSLEIFYMDTKRNPFVPFKIQAGKQAMAKVAKFKPDVVITSDDNAQEYFTRHYVGKAAPQFVFCGVNAEASEYGFPASNVTGILERPLFVQSFDLLLKIVPDAKSVVVLTDDSPTSDRLISYMNTLSLPVRVTAVDRPSTFDQWQECIRKYQDSVDAICLIVYHTLLEEKGAVTTVPPKKVMDWTVANNKKPLFSVAPFCVEEGAIFGVVNSGQEQGMEAARITKKILKGKKAGEIPMVKPRKGAVYINIRTAEKMDFEIPFSIIRSTDRIFE